MIMQVVRRLGNIQDWRSPHGMDGTNDKLVLLLDVLTWIERY